MAGEQQAIEHLVGLLLGTEDDWPRVYDSLLGKVGPVRDAAGRDHVFAAERLTIEPFSLRAKPRTGLIIDRLAYWYYHPREWLKKVALMDDVYLLNSPFTFQSMEKHAAYCAMMRLGLKVPETVLVPYKNPLDNARYAYTSAQYNRPFDLDAIAAEIGYPLYMKPYDGGAWRGVSRIRDVAELHRAYDESGEMLMHLQAAIDGFDVFARALSIGAETMVMRFDPDAPMHERYRVEHEFLDAAAGEIDYANACPDVAVTSLHYYFPWAIRALVKWTVFCLVTGRRPRLDLDTRAYFEIADRDDLDYEHKLAAYRRLSDAYFDTERYRDFCDRHLAGLDEQVLDWMSGPHFFRVLLDTVRATYPAHEQDRFLDHFRGLVGMWISDEAKRLRAP